MVLRVLIAALIVSGCGQLDLNGGSSGLTSAGEDVAQLAEDPAHWTNSTDSGSSTVGFGPDALDKFKLCITWQLSITGSLTINLSDIECAIKVPGASVASFSSCAYVYSCSNLSGDYQLVYRRKGSDVQKTLWSVFKPAEYDYWSNVSSVAGPQKTNSYSDADFQKIADAIGSIGLGSNISTARETYPEILKQTAGEPDNVWVSIQSGSGRRLYASFDLCHDRLGVVRKIYRDNQLLSDDSACDPLSPDLFIASVSSVSDGMSYTDLSSEVRQMLKTSDQITYVASRYSSIPAFHSLYYVSIEVCSLLDSRIRSVWLSTGQTAGFTFYKPSGCRQAGSASSSSSGGSSGGGQPIVSYRVVFNYQYGSEGYDLSCQVGSWYVQTKQVAFTTSASDWQIKRLDPRCFVPADAQNDVVCNYTANCSMTSTSCLPKFIHGAINNSVYVDVTLKICTNDVSLYGFK